jgi:hypothetical protein
LGKQLSLQPKPTTINMKTIQKLMALGALAALPIGTVAAVELSTNIPHEVKAEDEETKTVNLKITGMT